jgi:hypothetical protein
MSAQTSTKFQSFNWLRGVADDSRISIIHRLVLIRLLLHRHNDGRCNPGYDSVAGELGVGRATIFRAVDLGIRFGWLAGFSNHGGRAKRNFVFTFPTQQSQSSDGSTVSHRRRSKPQQSQKSASTVSQGQHNSLRRNQQDSDSINKFERNGGTNGKRERGKKESQTPRKKTPGGEERTQQESQGERRGAAADAGDAFERFWRTFPRKVAKQAACKAFAKALENGTAVETLIAGAQRYAVERQGQDPKYTKHPATWLNGGCWEDEAPGAPVIDEAGNVVAFEREQEARPSSNKSPLEIYEEWLEENPSLRW